jgi:hypothetical protein
MEGEPPQRLTRFYAKWLLNPHARQRGALDSRRRKPAYRTKQVHHRMNPESGRWSSHLGRGSGYTADITRPAAADGIADTSSPRRKFQSAPQDSRAAESLML